MWGKHPPQGKLGEMASNPCNGLLTATPNNFATKAAASCHIRAREIGILKHRGTHLRHFRRTSCVFDSSDASLN